MTLPADHIAAGLVIVFEHWGEAAGFVVVVPREDGKADLDGPFVEPDLWRSGIGRKLVDEAVQFAMALVAYCRSRVKGKARTSEVVLSMPMVSLPGGGMMTRIA